jgi:MFS superfamily sulfate permease-like transporter
VWNDAYMSAWSLLAVPLCLAVVVGLLWGVAWFERRMLSPRSMILYTVRSRHAGPDTVEVLIASQSEGLLRNLR